MFNKRTGVYLIGTFTSLVLLGCTSPAPNANTNKLNSLASPSPSTITQTSVAVKSPEATLTPATNWQENNHVHGLGVNPQNADILYIATHNGLLQRSESGKWFWVGKARNDYMGFNAHPTDSNRFYASGHPPTGGNLGFQVSENGGEDWKLLSMPGVDFHALAVAPSNPDVIYGWATSGKRGLFVSQDGGKNWTQVQPNGLNSAPFNLVVDPNSPEHILATTRGGLYESTNGGNDWKLIGDTQANPIVGLALAKSDSNNPVMYGYRLDKSSPGLYRSTDNGKNWQPLGTGINGTVLYVAIAPSNPQILYAVNDNNIVFASQDSGKNWQQLT